MVNHYHVLGISENATPVEIKAAFKRLAVKYHPDKHSGHPEMEEKFKEINTAYQILSDEYEKARFDLRLRYQQFATEQRQQPYQYTRRPRHTTYPPRPRPGYRRPYTPVDYKQNAIATAYAFMITLGIALVVMCILWAKNSYDEHQLEKLLAERRKNYEEALTSFQNGNYRSAFDIMSEMKLFRRSEDDIRRFKQNMVSSMILKGDQNFMAGDYRGAIALYEMVLSLDVTKQKNFIKENLAESYAASGQAEKALKVLRSFLLDGYNSISTLVRIAKIQNEMLEQPDEALENLLTAHRLAIKRYKAFYGEGYALVINEEYVPKSHYYLYRDLANQYLKLGDTEMAIKAADWNKYVWPDSTDAYQTTAEALVVTGNLQAACREYEEAKARNWSGKQMVDCI